MTSLLSQIEAAAALGEKATKRPWVPGCVLGQCRKVHKHGTGDCDYQQTELADYGGHDIVGGHIEVGAPSKEAIAVAGNYDYEEGGICRGEDRDYIVAAANLPLAAIAEELRAKDAEIAKLLTILDDSGAGKMHRRCQKAESLLRRFVKYADSINRHGSDAFMALVKEAEALAAKESAND